MRDISALNAIELHKLLHSEISVLVQKFAHGEITSYQARIFFFDSIRDLLPIESEMFFRKTMEEKLLDAILKGPRVPSTADIEQGMTALGKEVRNGSICVIGARERFRGILQTLTEHERQRWLTIFDQLLSELAKPTSGAFVVRWIAFFPTAIVACLVGRFVIVGVNRFGLARYVEPDSFLWRLVDQYVSGLSLGAIAVYVASYVAPSHKKHVAVLMAGLVLMLAGFILFPSVQLGSYSAIFELLCMALGAGAVGYAILTEEIKFEGNPDAELRRP